MLCFNTLFYEFSSAGHNGKHADWTRDYADKKGGSLKRTSPLPLYEYTVKRGFVENLTGALRFQGRERSSLFPRQTKWLKENHPLSSADSSGRHMADFLVTHAYTFILSSFIFSLSFLLLCSLASFVLSFFIFFLLILLVPMFRLKFCVLYFSICLRFFLIYFSIYAFVYVLFCFFSLHAVCLLHVFNLPLNASFSPHFFISCYTLTFYLPTQIPPLISSV